MIRTFTLLISAISIPFISLAQPAFNSMKIPAIGSTISVQAISDETVVPGNGGVNQLWDFSSVTFTGSSVSSQIKSPASTPYASTFTNANLSELSAQGNYMYYDISTTKEDVLGIHDNSQGVTIKYTNPMTILQFPIAYNATQTDDFSANYTANSIPIAQSGTITSKYDGYGTLKTSYGTYNNVGRFTVTKSESALMDYGSGITMTMTTNSTTTSWLLPGYSNSLFSILDVEILLEDMPYSSSHVVYLTNPSFLTETSSAHLQNLHIAVGPNPATDALIVSFNDVESDNYDLSVVNENGNEVLNESFYAEQNSNRVTDIKSLNSGIYFVRISSSKGIKTEKIIKK